LGYLSQFAPQGNPTYYVEIPVILATMAPSTKENPDKPDSHLDETMGDDDVTVVAETPSTKKDFIEEEMIDLKVRYETSHRNGKGHDNDYKLHVQLLQAITKSIR
jgi:hypothetical protein